MRNPYCFHLDINVPVFKPGKNFTNYQANKYHNKFPTKNNASDELIDFMKSVGLILWYEFEIFQSELNSNTIIHTDIEPGDFPKLNYVFDGKDSVMNWYEPKIENNQIEVSLDNRPYISYHQNEVDLKHCEAVGLGNPSIVQTGVPHNVTTSTESRCCVSFIYVIEKTLTRPTFNECYTIFEKYLL